MCSLYLRLMYQNIIIYHKMYVVRDRIAKLIFLDTVQYLKFITRYQDLEAAELEKKKKKRVQ